MSSNAQKKSSIIKDALVLCIITLVAGFALGMVYDITLPTIEARNLQTKMDAYRTAYPTATDFVEDDTLNQQASEAVQTALEPKGLTNITIDEARIATDASGDKLGYVVVVSTGEGYGGTITLLLGYSLDGTVQGMEILTINETAGLGMKAKEPAFKNQFFDKHVTEFAYTKTGATAENEIDALSGATITTRAVTNAMNAGLCFITDVVEAGNNMGGE